MSVSLLANAKINPTLRVLGRRTDGYHELATTLLALDLADVVTVDAADSPGPVEVDVRGPFASPDVPLDGTNLAVRGAEVARTLAGSDEALRIDVSKNVPSRAGLGGGSADAAAAARATLVEFGEDDDALGEALAELGSDCAFFHEARATGAALALGRGELVLPVPGPRDWWIALVTPAVECSTPEVYAALGRERGTVRATIAQSERADARALFALPAIEARERLVNDLESAARAAEPALDAWFDLLGVTGHSHFRLAGSGSTLFGLFADDVTALEALARIEAAAIERALGVRLSCLARPAGAALTVATAGGA